MNYVDLYVEARPLHEAFTAKVRHLVGELLESESIQAHLVEARTKEVSSFKEKISREGKDYGNPLEDLTDLSGIRIVAYTIDEVERIATLIENEFEIDSENSIDKSKTLRPDQFGYLSKHYVVRLSAIRAGLLENAKYSQLRAEIQVRTVLQHAWAVIDHKLRYKSVNNPQALEQRRLFRLSGMLEVADEQFSSMMQDYEAAATETTTAIRAKQYSIPLTAIGLTGYVFESERARSLFRWSVEANLSPALENLFEEPDDEIVDDFLFFARKFGVSSIEELDDQLLFKESIVREYFKSIKNDLEPGFNFRPTPVMVVLLVVWLRNASKLSADDMLERGWMSDFADPIVDLIGKTKTEIN